MATVARPSAVERSYLWCSMKGKVALYVCTYGATLQQATSDCSQRATLAVVPPGGDLCLRTGVNGAACLAMTFFYLGTDVSGAVKVVATAGRGFIARTLPSV